MPRRTASRPPQREIPLVEIPLVDGCCSRLGMPVNDSPFKHFRNLGGHGQDAGMGEVALDRQREVIHANVIG